MPVWFVLGNNREVQLQFVLSVFKFIFIDQRFVFGYITYDRGAIGELYGRLTQVNPIQISDSFI